MTKVEVAVPIVPKSMTEAARKIAAAPPELLFSTADGIITIRTDQLNEKDTESFVKGFLEADDANREKSLRFILSGMKKLTEERQWLADQLIKVGEMMENFYRKAGLPQPD